VQSVIVSELVGMSFGGAYIDDPPNSSLAQMGRMIILSHFLGLLWTA
jgi:hypothetical protein